MKKQEADATVSIRPVRKRSTIREVATLSFVKRSSVEEQVDKVQKLLRDVRALIEKLSHQESELINAISVHEDRAKARLSCSNETGATLSHKRLVQCQSEHEKLTRAMDYLKQQERRLMEILREAKRVVALDALSGSNTSSRGDLDSLASFMDYQAQVDRILCSEEED